MMIYFFLGSAFSKKDNSGNVTDFRALNRNALQRGIIFYPADSNEDTLKFIAEGINSTDTLMGALSADEAVRKIVSAAKKFGFKTVRLNPDDLSDKPGVQALVQAAGEAVLTTPDGETIQHILEISQEVRPTVSGSPVKLPPKPKTRLERLFPGETLIERNNAFKKASTRADEKINKGNYQLEADELYTLFHLWNMEETINPTIKKAGEVPERVIAALYSLAAANNDTDTLNDLADSGASPTFDFLEVQLSAVFRSDFKYTESDKKRLQCWFRVNPTFAFNFCLKLTDNHHLRNTLIREYSDNSAIEAPSSDAIHEAFNNAITDGDIALLNLLGSSRTFVIDPSYIANALLEACAIHNTALITALLSFENTNVESNAENNRLVAYNHLSHAITAAINQESHLLPFLLHHRMVRVGEMQVEDWKTFIAQYKLGKSLFKPEIQTKLNALVKVIPMAMSMSQDKNPHAQAAGKDFLKQFQALVTVVLTEDERKIPTHISRCKPALEKAFTDAYNKLPRSDWDRLGLNLMFAILVPVVGTLAVLLGAAFCRTEDRKFGLFAESRAQQKIQRMREAVSVVEAPTP